MSGLIGSAGSKSGVIGETESGQGCYFIMSNSSDDGWQSVASNTDIPWSSIEIDEDNWCTSGTGAHFTAPARGYYFFGAIIYVGQDDDANYFTFNVNDTLPNYMAAGDHYMTSIADIDQTLNGHIIYKLNAGDTVSCTASSESNYYSGHSLFYGHRIA